MTHDTQTRETLVEVMARAICKVNEVSDDVFTEQPLHNRWIEDAAAAILALEAAGARLVPDGPTQEMLEAVRRSKKYCEYEGIAHEDAYAIMLAASPYAKD